MKKNILYKLGRSAVLATAIAFSGLEAKAENNENSKKTTSKEAIALIKKYEGFSPKEYPCPAGKRTIGYGHLIKEGEKFDIISEQEAEIKLREDLAYAEKAVKKYVDVPLNQKQYDALCSFVYNIGEGNFRKSTLLQKLNSDDYSGASQEFSRWVYGNGKKLKGLEKRREEERKLFLKEK